MYEGIKWCWSSLLMLPSHQQRNANILNVYSREFTRSTIYGFSRHSLHSHQRGRGLSLWLYSMETVVIVELTTSSALILVEDVPQTCEHVTPRVWVHNINIIFIYLFMTSPVGSHSSVPFTGYVCMTVSSSSIRAAVRFTNSWLAFATQRRVNFLPKLKYFKSSEWGETFTWIANICVFTLTLQFATFCCERSTIRWFVSIPHK